jgi:hypothetical protein
MQDKKRKKVRGHSDASATQRGTTARNTTGNPRFEQRFPRTLDMVIAIPTHCYEWKPLTLFLYITTGRAKAVI